MSLEKADTARLKSGQGAGVNLAHLRDGLFSPVFLLYIVFPVVTAVVIHLGGRFAYRQGVLQLYTADAITLAGILLMLMSAVLIMYHVYRMRLITYVTITAALCLLVGQGLNVLAHAPAWELVKESEPAAGARVLFRDTCFVTGVALLISVYVLSLYESNRARRMLADAYTDIEGQVDERTASLIEANRQLEQEIHVRGEAEEALRLSEEKFRALVENSADIILRLDPDLRVLYANPTLLSMTGKRAGDFLGHPIEAVLGSVRATEAWQRVARQVVAAAKAGRVETRTGEGDSLQLLDWSIAPETDASGRVISLLTVARDMTQLWRKEMERRTLEEQLVQSQKLESIGRLAGGVAHDFNNLLQVISGYVELAMTEIDADHSVHSRLCQVDKAARRATSLVRQLLAFSRRETMRCEHLDLNRLILDMGKMFQRVLGEQYEINIAASLGLPLIHADAGHVEQVLMNLCVNARDAMPAGGTIRIETRSVAVAAETAAVHGEAKPGIYVETLVSDSGTGMTSEVLTRIFEPFYTTKEMGKGTGLGLAVVYGLVKQHGGFLEVESRPGIGSTFSVFFPASPEGTTESEQESEKSLPPEGRGETLLLAEDDEQVRELTKSTLERSGYRVVEAADGLQALSLVEERHAEIDLFILDAIMPQKNGRDVYEAIVALRPDARILFVTGHSFNTLAEVNLPARGCELLHKPLSSKDLLTKIREMLEA